MLVGLAAKNAILIVEFARQAEASGASRFDAAIEAARTRLRPVLMTSFAFILGVVPLVIASVWAVIRAAWIAWPSKAVTSPAVTAAVTRPSGARSKVTLSAPASLPLT